MNNTDTSKPTLHYFAGNGRGAMIRAIFHSQNVDFVDNQIQHSDWPALKKSGKFEFEQLPILEWNGKYYSQTLAIVIYLGRKYNLLGSNAEEEYEIISLLASSEDIAGKLRPIAWPQNDTEKGAVQENRKQFFEGFGAQYLKIYENRFTKNNGKYVVGNKFSLADILVGVQLGLVFKSPTLAAGYENSLETHAPKLAAHTENLKKNELASFYEKGFVKGAPF